MIGLFAVNQAQAIYIKPAPADLSDTGKALASDIEDTKYPAVGVVIAPDSRSTGSLISPDDPKKAADPNISWVLTAGHSLTDSLLDKPFGDNKMTFQPEGIRANPSPTQLQSDFVRRYPLYDGKKTALDVGLFRLNGIAKDGNGKVIDPLKLQRKQPAALEPFTLVGFGKTGPDLFDKPFGAKRQAQFVGDDYEKNPIVVSDTSFGAGTRDDPKRQACEGDSGGPLLFGSEARIGGVMGAVGAVFDVKCGQRATQLAANTTQQALYNWIDNYMEKGINWDNLNIKKAGAGQTTAGLGDVVIHDSFEAGGEGYQLGGTGLPEGWAFANDYSIDVPNVGKVGPNYQGWRYINAIGTDNEGNPELYTDGNSGLGEIDTGGGYSLISKTFGLAGGFEYTLDIQQSWNSGGLIEGVGVLFGDNSIWSALEQSDANLAHDPATWFDRSLRFDLTNFSGPVSVSVVLLNGVVPEPGAAFLLLEVLLLLGLAQRYAGRAAGTRRSRSTVSWL